MPRVSVCGYHSVPSAAGLARKKRREGRKEGRNFSKYVSHLGLRLRTRAETPTDSQGGSGQTLAAQLGRPIRPGSLTKEGRPIADTAEGGPRTCRCTHRRCGGPEKREGITLAGSNWAEDEMGGRGGYFSRRNAAVTDTLCRAEDGFAVSASILTAFSALGGWVSPLR